MTTNEHLTDLFRRFEKAKKEVRVSFANDSVYELQILSTGHAEAGGDIVADVVRSVRSDCPDLWETAAMNFKLDHVVRVEAGDECLFAKIDG